jgi:protein SCO1/2
MTARVVRALAAAGLLGLAFVAQAAPPAPAAPALKAGVFEPAQAAPDFTLRGSDGVDVSLSRFKGRVVLLVFGFTNCPQVCPTTMATLAQARRALGADAAGMQVVYVTVDPARDDPARMKTWLASFDRSFVGGTGTPAALAEVYRRYGIDAKKIPFPDGTGYGMAHSSSIYLIDRAGRLRALMPYGHDAADFVHDVRLLLASQ